MLLPAVVGYALGSIPFGVLLTRLFRLGDLRAIGSGNIGATNVLRTGRKDVAAATLLLDAGKGTLAALLFTGDAALVAGVLAVLGHCTSPWVRFRGGKGVATALGVLLGWSWLVAVLACLSWLLTAFATRLSSAASLVATALAPVLMLALRPWPWAVATALISLLIAVRHRGNIERLLAGTEPRIGAGR